MANRTIFHNEGDSAEKAVVIIIASATGVPKRFYTQYATYLTSLPTVRACYTFDYTGIDVSIQDLKSKFKNISIKKDWVADLESVLDDAANKYPSLDIVYIGHSVGGHLLGFLDQKRRSQIKRALFVGANVPYYKYLGEFGGRVWIYHSCISPLVYGYYPSSHLGLGLPLPSRVGEQWGFWSRFKDYMTHNPKTKALFNECTIPIESIGFDDDKIASKDALNQLLAVYPSSKRRFLFMNSSNLGLPQGTELGHFMYFKTPSIWPLFNPWILEGVRLDVQGTYNVYNAAKL